MEIEDRYNIVKGIYWLFHEDRGARSFFNAPVDSESELWDEYWLMWLATNTHTNSIREWLTVGAEMSDRFDGPTLSWMVAASKSAKVLIEPWVQTLAKVWLTKTGFDNEAYMDKSERIVWMMHGLTSLDEDGNIETPLQDFAFYQLDFSVLSAARLRELANFGLDETSPHWHTGLAWIHMEAGHNDDAIHHFQEALAIEAQAWLPKEGLARVYGEQDRLPEAIQMMEDAYNSLPEKFAFLGGFLLPYIAEWKKRTGDYEGAYEIAYQGYIAEPSSHIAQDKYLRALNEREIQARSFTV
ncbi:MAG: hypothetical protein Q9222_002563 [Ikaeria aurantiellina]